MENANESGTNDSDDATMQGKTLPRILSEAHFPDCHIFPQGCQFSPDGLCILTAESHEFALYNTSLNEGKEWRAAFRCPAGDAVRDYAFYPHMDSQDPSTCCFLGTAR
jgi:sugar lactone lactonase YvrE